MLDVAFREDYARKRKDHSAANQTVLRKITQNAMDNLLAVHRTQVTFSKCLTTENALSYQGKVEISPLGKM
jgi:hypothetical protein